MTMGIDSRGSAAREDDPLASAKSDDSDKSADRAARTPADTNDDRGHQRAETRTREEYAADRRASESPAARDNSQDNGEAAEQGHQGQPERRADHDRAEVRDRGTYADDTRADHSAVEHRDRADATADRPAGPALEPSPASNGHRAEQAPEDHAASWRQTAEAPGLADADRTATSDGADENELVSSGERPEADQPDDRGAGADQAAISARDQRETGLLPETITFDNKDIEVTHNAADGIWIEGLPGEPPARIGDLVPSAEDPAQGRGEKLRKEFNKEAEDISDTAGKWADHVQEILDNPRPTHSMTHNRSPETAITGSDHGINAGQGAEAVVMLAVVGTAVVHKLRERWQRPWDH